MGATSSACAPQNAASRALGGPWVISVVRSVEWGWGDEEDVWPVEVSQDCSVLELKAKIEELYDVPQQAQKIASSGDSEAPALEDGVKLATLGAQRVHLLPMQPPPSSEEESMARDVFAQAMIGAIQENMEMSAALEESLQGVSYTIRFRRPPDAEGVAAGKQVSLKLDALALVGDIQEIVEIELFGSVGLEPAFLTLDGALLPAEAPLHFAGLDDSNKIVDVLKDAPLMSEEEQLLQSLVAGAGTPALTMA